SQKHQQQEDQACRVGLPPFPSSPHSLGQLRVVGLDSFLFYLQSQLNRGQGHKNASVATGLMFRAFSMSQMWMLL
ncbi:unnamed protein product, partial [Brassica rapa subsp. trilocularis]